MLTKSFNNDVVPDKVATKLSSKMSQLLKYREAIFFIVHNKLLFKYITFEKKSQVGALISAEKVFLMAFAVRMSAGGSCIILSSY